MSGTNLFFVEQAPLRCTPRDMREATAMPMNMYARCAGVHYKPTAGTLVFESGEREKDIEVPLIAGEADLQFSVTLSSPEVADLHTKRSTCDVYFVNDRKFGIIMKMVQSIVRRQNRAESKASPWLDQFKEAIVPGGAGTGEDGVRGQALQPLDYLLHFISFSWKVRCVAEARMMDVIDLAYLLPACQSTARCLHAQAAAHARKCTLQRTGMSPLAGHLCCGAASRVQVRRAMLCCVRAFRRPGHVHRWRVCVPVWLRFGPA